MSLDVRCDTASYRKLFKVADDDNSNSVNVKEIVRLMYDEDLSEAARPPSRPAPLPLRAWPAVCADALPVRLCLHASPFDHSRFLMALLCGAGPRLM